jgi:hypothetical protein
MLYLELHLREHSAGLQEGLAHFVHLADHAEIDAAYAARSRG